MILSPDRARHALIAGHIDRRRFVALAIAANASGAQAEQAADHAQRVRANQLARTGHLLPECDVIVCGAGTADSHKTLQMVERYSHQNGEHIQAAMDKLQRRLAHGPPDTMTREPHKGKKPATESIAGFPL